MNQNTLGLKNYVHYEQVLAARITEIQLDTSVASDAQYFQRVGGTIVLDNGAKKQVSGNWLYDTKVKVGDWYVEKGDRIWTMNDASFTAKYIHVGVSPTGISSIGGTAVSLGERMVSDLGDTGTPRPDLLLKIHSVD